MSNANVGVSKVGEVNSSVTQQEYDRIHRKLHLQFERQAKVEKHRLETANVPVEQQTFRVALKWLAEAHRIGVTHICGLKLVK